MQCPVLAVAVQGGGRDGQRTVAPSVIIFRKVALWLEFQSTVLIGALPRQQVFEILHPSLPSEYHYCSNQIAGLD